VFCDEAMVHAGADDAELLVARPPGCVPVKRVEDERSRAATMVCRDCRTAIDKRGSLHFGSSQVGGRSSNGVRQFVKQTFNQAIKSRARQYPW
jgi:hypothetical protein